MFIAWSALFHVRPAPAKFQGRKTRNLVDANWKTNNILREALRTDSNLAKVSLQRGKSSGKSRLKMCGSILFCSPLLITIGSARRQAAHASCLFLRFCVSLSSDLSLDGPQLLCTYSLLQSILRRMESMHQRHTCQRLNVYVIQHHTANDAQSNQTFRCSVITT